MFYTKKFAGEISIDQLANAQGGWKTNDFPSLQVPLTSSMLCGISSPAYRKEQSLIYPLALLNIFAPGFLFYYYFMPYFFLK